MRLSYLTRTASKTIIQTQGRHIVSDTVNTLGNDRILIH